MKRPALKVKSKLSSLKLPKVQYEESAIHYTNGLDEDKLFEDLW